MALIELKCDKCGYVFEELISSNGEYPSCPKCGGKTDQKYSGKLCVNFRKSENCNGNCSGCGGCGNH